MPTYYRPKVAHVEPGGTDWGALVLIGAGVGAAAAVVLFVFAHLVLLAVCAAVFVVVVGGLAVGMAIHYREGEPLPLPRGRPANAGRELGSQPGALDAPPLAIAPVIHQHIHFHGVTPEDAAAITQASRRDAR